MKDDSRNIGKVPRRPVVLRWLCGAIQEHRWWIVGAVVLLHVAAISSQWHVMPDSATYLLLGQSLDNGDGYAIDGHLHGKYPPGFPLYLAAANRLGMGGMVWLNALMCVMTISTLWFTYRLLREHTTGYGALMGTVLLAVLYQMYRVSTAQLSDVPFLLLVTAGLWCLVRGLQNGRCWLEVGGLLLVASCWVRVLGLPLTLMASVGLALQNRRVPGRRLWPNIVGMIAGVAATAIWLYVHDRAVQAAAPGTTYECELSLLSSAGFWQWLVRPLSNFYESGDALARFFTAQRMPPLLAMAVFWLPVFVGAYHSLRKRQYLIACAASGYLGAIVILRVPLARYFLPIAPILLLYWGDGMRIIGIWCNTLSSNKHLLPAKGLWIAFACILIAMNVPKDLRLIYRLHHSRGIELQGRQDIALVAEFLRKQSDDDMRFVSSRYPVVLAYLSGVSHRPVGRMPAAQAPSSSDILDCLHREAVDFVIVWPEATKVHPVHRAIRDTICQHDGYRSVFCQGVIEVFGRVDFPVPTRPSLHALNSRHDTNERKEGMDVVLQYDSAP